MLQMEYSSFDVIQPISFFGRQRLWYDVTQTDDATFYDFPFFNSSGYYSQEGLLRAIMPLPSMEDYDEDDFATNQWDNIGDSEVADEEANWFWQCKSIFSWQDDRGDTNDGIISTELDKTESSDQSETVFAGLDEDAAENYSAPSEYDLWSLCDSLLEYGGEKKVCSNCGRDESEYAVYESIFGYWPCLYGRY